MANIIKANLSIENARIGFRNFSGREGQFNAKGRRNFVVFLDDDDARDLADDGWNIRWLKPRGPDEDPQAYLPVEVSFNNYPPRIMVVTSTAKNQLDEESVDSLDWADIETVDLVIRPYHWTVGEKSGIKAYLKAAYVSITEDEFASKYDLVPLLEPDNE